MKKPDPNNPIWTKFLIWSFDHVSGTELRWKRILLRAFYFILLLIPLLVVGSVYCLLSLIGQIIQAIGRGIEFCGEKPFTTLIWNRL